MDDLPKKELHIVPPQLLLKAGAAALGMLALFLLVLTISALRGLPYVGAGVPATNTISVSGEGETFAVPDTATFTVTVQEEAAQVADAQDSATEKMNGIIDYLKGEGVEEKDIKTVSYNVMPKYEYDQQFCPVGTYCQPGNQTLAGFQVSQTLSVKVKDTKKAGELLSGVGSRGVFNVSGLSFTIDDEDALRAEARNQAIEDARAKAEALAGDLGVDLVRVVGFYEDSSYPPMYAYGLGGMELSRDAKVSSAPAPALPTGENKIVSNVNITYEIK